VIVLKSLKSAYEIAMERAEKIADDNMTDNNDLEKREEAKKILATYHKKKINSDELWQDLKDKNDLKLNVLSQKLLIEALGLHTNDQQFKRIKEGVLAIESLKSESSSSMVEQLFDSVKELQAKYSEEREKMKKRLEDEFENNSQVQMKPVQTDDGKTVMKLEPSIDENTKKRLNDMMNNLEEQSSHMLNQLVDKLKSVVEIN